MNAILHAMYAKPVEIECVKRRVVKPSWVDSHSQSELNKIYEELRIFGRK